METQEGTVDPEFREHLIRHADSLVQSDTHYLDQLVAIRKSSGLSITELADRMGVSKDTVVRFERYDANPKLSTIRRYALAVGAIVRHTVIEDPFVPSSSSQQKETSDEE